MIPALIVVALFALVLASTANASAAPFTPDVAPAWLGAAPSFDTANSATLPGATAVEGFPPVSFDDQPQLPTFMEATAASLSPASWAPPDIAPDTAAMNTRAFLDMLAVSEGTSGPNGYRTMFGGGLFDDFTDHPRIAHQFTDQAGRTLWTSAAGRYQFMAVSPIPAGGSTRVNTWDVLQEQLSLPDFSPDSQDQAAAELIRQRGALGDVQAGRFEAAIAKCAKTWASLPGAGYAQHENKLSKLVAAYTAAGGTVTA